MSALSELAERCEKATGPDRELNIEIALAVWPHAKRRTGKFASTELDIGGGWFNAPKYTASLDAAMSLVPEGWDWTTQTSFRKSKARANCDLTQEAPFKPEDWKVTTARAATPALALCAAALRARGADQ